VVAAARLSGEPILPVALVARPRIRFRSWDRTQLPLPFARVVVGFGERIRVERSATDEEQDRVCRVLDGQLVELRATATGRLAEPRTRSPRGIASSH
jgi:lysophospholipid acyltransferase (LPLAT)-like uncharacterized protein